VASGDIGTVIENCDGLATGMPNKFLTVTVADCFPIYFFNPATNTVGLAHSGWRGTVANIPGEMVKVMGKNAGVIMAGIGPGIQSCHFKIKKDILEKFLAYPESIIHRGNKIFIDLPLIIRKQLTKAGVRPKNIENCAECTFCLKDKYFSFRRDKPKAAQTMIAYIGLNQ
jgi:YfiH family protein